MPTPEEVLSILDLVDDYVPDGTIIGPDNSDETDLLPADFLFDPDAILQASESGSIQDIVDDPNDLEDSDKDPVVENNFAGTSDSSTNVSVENIEVTNADDTDNSVSNVTNIVDPEITDAVDDLTVATSDLTDIVAEGTEEQNDLLASIDKTLDAQYQASERERRKNAIINETTPFDFLVDQGGISGSRNQNGSGSSLADLAAAAAGGGLLNRNKKGDDDPDKKKKWSEKTGKEKLKTGGKAAIVTALAGLVALTGYEKFFGDSGTPSWVPFVGEDDQGNSDSPVMDAATTVAALGATAYGANKLMQPKVDVTPTDVNSENLSEPEADKPKPVIKDGTAKTSLWDKVKSVGKSGSAAAGKLGGGLVTAAMTAAQIAELRNDDTLTEDQKNVGTARLVGGTATGALAGAATGAALGSVIPFFGTAIGALIGGAAGYYAAESSGLTDWGAQAAEDLYETSKDLGFFSDASETTLNEAEEKTALVDDTLNKKEVVKPVESQVDQKIEGTIPFATVVIPKGTETKSDVSVSDQQYVYDKQSSSTTDLITKSTNVIAAPSLVASVDKTTATTATDVQKLVTNNLATNFDIFGITLTDSINLLTSELVALNENLWDVVDIFEGDSETNKRLVDMQKEYELNKVENNSSMFSRMFDRSAITNNSAPAKIQPAKTQPSNYVLDANQTQSYTTATNINEADINVQPDAPMIMEFPVVQQPQAQQQYGNQNKAKQSRPDKATIKTVTKRDFNKSSSVGIGGGSPTLANTPVHIEDATLQLINMGAL